MQVATGVPLNKQKKLLEEIKRENAELNKKCEESMKSYIEDIFTVVCDFLYLHPINSLHGMMKNVHPILSETAVYNSIINNNTS